MVWRQEIPIIPSDDNIDTVIASVREIEFYTRKVPSYTIPATFVSLVMSTLRTTIKCDQQSWYKPVVDLTVILKDGKKLEIDVYYSGKTSMVFAIDGVTYTRAGEYRPTRVSGSYEQYCIEAMELAYLIECLQKPSATDSRDTECLAHARDLERSMGLRKPATATGQ
jgi:hypothetical protein